MTRDAFRGRPVCDGVGFGRVYRIDRRELPVPQRRILPDQVAFERSRFDKAIQVSERQLHELEQRAAQTGLAQVDLLLKVHAALLRDAALRDATIERIEMHHQNAEWALRDTVQSLKRLFDELDQHYFRERRSDVEIVADRILRNLVGEQTEIQDIDDDTVVVAYDLSPADTVALARFAAKGFVTEHGGPTSHTAVLARALGIPCVLNVSGIMADAAQGDPVIVDGYAGDVFLRPSEQSTRRLKRLRKRRKKEQEALLADRHLPAETRDGVRIALLGNIEVSHEASAVLRYGGEGVGLYRTEFLFAENPEFRGTPDHIDAYVRVVQSLEGRCVTIRTFDLGGAQPHDPGGHVLGENPALGLRGIRASLVDLGPFRDQIAGILVAGAEGPVRLLLPLVTGIDEVIRAREAVGEVAKQLDRDGVRHADDVEIGAMIETPASALVIDVLAREADFFAVGTNDLIQYVLATDRGNAAVADLYRPSHPAVLRLLSRAVADARRASRPLSVCGEMAADPFHVPLLVGLGVDALSMSPRTIPIVKRMIRRLSAEACRAFADEAMTLPTPTEVDRRLSERLRAWTPELFN